jgi:hypothetical protein
MYVKNEISSVHNTTTQQRFIPAGKKLIFACATSNSCVETSDSHALRR